MRRRSKNYHQHRATVMDSTHKPSPKQKMASAMKTRTLVSCSGEIADGTTPSRETCVHSTASQHDVQGVLDSCVMSWKLSTVQCVSTGSMAFGSCWMRSSAIQFEQV